MSSNPKKILPFQKPSPSGNKAAPQERKPVPRAELDLILQKARELAKKAPQKAAMILTSWLNKPRNLANDREIPPKKKTG